MVNKEQRAQPRPVRIFRPVVKRIPALDTECPRCGRVVSNLYDLGQAGRGYYCIWDLIALADEIANVTAIRGVR
jgi:hypothetical protein